MLKRVLLSGLSVFVAWTILDLLLHRLALAPLYDQNPSLWRPFSQMNVGLIYVVVFGLIATFIGMYQLLIRPKSLGAGLRFGAFIGFALGISAGFGTYIHMPIPLALAWGWLIGGWFKALVAGAIVGTLIIDSRDQSSSNKK